MEVAAGSSESFSAPLLVSALVAFYPRRCFALFHSVKEALARGQRIELRGFGVFVVKPRKRGIGRNPRTGEEVAIPSGKTIRFKPGKELQAHGEGESLAQSAGNGVAEP